ncbi:MAG: hypothetical protein ACXW3C_11175 [Pyrinomonadaceae bacterium]
MILAPLLVASSCTLTKSEQTIGADFKVNAQSNVFRAGTGEADALGGGEPAPSVTFKAGAGKVLTFSAVTGSVSCCSGGDSFNDADGGTFAGGVTDVQSAGGISGITHPGKTMFLVGVFTDNSSPKGPAPPRLDATSERNLTPVLFQTFFIGTGKGKSIEVPPTATRLYLGFADASSFTGPPGAYDDNVGELIATFRIGPKTK